MPFAICAVHQVPAFANVPLDHIISFHNSTEPGPDTHAFRWLVYHGCPYDQAYQLVVDTRGPFVCPNQLMVKLADDLMAREGEMHAFVVEENLRRVPVREAFFKAHGDGAQLKTISPS